MIKGKRITVLALFAAIVGVALLTYGVVAIGTVYNVYQEHLVTGTTKAISCSGYVGGKACHDLGSRILNDAHRTHRSPMFLAFFDKASGAGSYDGCGRCHSVTDTLQSSGAKLNKQVTASGDEDYNPKVVCADCHGRPACPNITVDPEGTITNALTCLQAGCHLEAHPGTGTLGPVAAHTNATWISQPYGRARAYCTKCHGGQALFEVEEENPLP